MEEVDENDTFAKALSCELGELATESPMVGDDQAEQVTLKLREDPTHELSNKPNIENSEECAVDSHEPTRKGDLQEMEIAGDLDVIGAVVSKISPTRHH